MFIVSFQGEPGVRGPPGPAGPRGLGTQGPKVSLKSVLCEDQVPSVSINFIAKVYFSVDLFFLEG